MVMLFARYTEKNCKRDTVADDLALLCESRRYSSQCLCLHGLCTHEPHLYTSEHSLANSLDLNVDLQCPWSLKSSRILLESLNTTIALLSPMYSACCSSR